MPYYVAPFTFQFGTSLIEVDPGTLNIDCATLYSAVKLAQASEEGIIYDRIGRGSGLNNLGPGVQVGITVELLGSWQLYFQPGNYVVRIAGGNLIGGPAGDPIAYSAGVQTLLIQSANATVVTTGGGGGGGGATAADIWTYASRTLTASPGPSAAAIASQVRTELTTELGRIDVATSTRALETTAQAVKAKTDNLPADPASQAKTQEAVDAAKLAAALSA